MRTSSHQSGSSIRAFLLHLGLIACLGTAYSVAADVQIPAVVMVDGESADEPIIIPVPEFSLENPAPRPPAPNPPQVLKLPDVIKLPEVVRGRPEWRKSSRNPNPTVAPTAEAPVTAFPPAETLKTPVEELASELAIPTKAAKSPASNHWPTDDGLPPVIRVLRESSATKSSLANRWTESQIMTEQIPTTSTTAAPSGAATAASPIQPSFATPVLSFPKDPVATSDETTPSLPLNKSPQELEHVPTGELIAEQSTVVPLLLPTADAPATSFPPSPPEVGSNSEPGHFAPVIRSSRSERTENRKQSAWTPADVAIDESPIQVADEPIPRIASDDGGELTPNLAVTTSIPVMIVPRGVEFAIGAQGRLERATPIALSAEVEVDSSISIRVVDYLTAAQSLPSPNIRDVVVDAPELLQLEQTNASVVSLPNSEMSSKLAAAIHQVAPPKSTAEPTTTVEDKFQDNLRPITALTSRLPVTSGQVPSSPASERFADAGQTRHVTGYSRSGGETWFHWEPPAVCHRPLLFEDPNLERHGTRVPMFQPAVSGAHFFARLPALPYLMVAGRNRECTYTLGHYRPGSYAPYYWYLPRFSLDATTFEGAIVTGLMFAIP